MSARRGRQQASGPPATARYVAIIADGNRRWAREHGLPLAAGHDAAADTLEARVGDAAELGIRELTVYVFSTENWSRPAREVKGLMDMLTRRLEIVTPELHRNGVRMRFLGSREGIPAQLIERMDHARCMTEENRRLTLFMAINYGGRAEILQAARRFHGSTERELGALLYAPEMHDPEVIVRTGAERRLSNFLLWQSAYSELVFRDELWPDFTRRALEESLAEFSDRRRRFGGR
jgi:undecaprenyl diphosphate synthase